MNRKKIILLASLVVFSYETMNAEESMPLYAKPGQCFTKSFYPPKVTKTTRTKSTKKVLINDSSIKYEVIPAKYTWESKRVKVSDGTEKIVTTPALYKTVYERVLVEPSYTIWKKNLYANSKKAFASCVESAKASGMNVDNAEVGTCFYEHYQPAKYVNTTSKILVAEASERIEVIPAKYKKVTKKIITDSTTAKLVPSVAKYKHVKAKVEVEPARTEWRKTVCNDRGCNQSEVVCLTEVPTTYKTVTKKIVLEPAVETKMSVSPKFETMYVQELLEPASQKVIPIPARYQTIMQKKEGTKAKYYWSDASSKDATTRYRSECDKICLTKIPAKYQKVAKKVVVTPASSKKITTPAEYKIVKVKKIEKEASFKKIVIPAEYVTVVTEKERTKGFAKWMPMVCEEMLTPDLIKKIQRALKFQGYYNGMVDGQQSLELKQATRAYQRTKGLAVTNKISIEAMKSLSIY